jgi:hypothetical protein
MPFAKGYHPPTEFKKGHVYNPKGRPKGSQNASTRFRKLLRYVEKHPDPRTGKLRSFTGAEILDMQQIALARKGDTKAYHEIMDRMEGKAVQAVDITSGGEKLGSIEENKRKELSDEFDKFLEAEN